MKGKITLFAVLVAIGAAALFAMSMRKDMQVGDNYTPPSGQNEYNPQINPGEFTTKVDNQYFALIPGTTFAYKKETDEGLETGEFTITNQTRTVMGVETVVVWDRVWFNGNLLEETYDWFAQHQNGDVWYFGEDTKEYENGEVSSTQGSWEAGINGAKPGIMMKAEPKVGDSYYQEFYKGEAEDKADVVALGESITTSYGALQNCIKTFDYTALDPMAKEYKYYCRSAGQLALTLDQISGEKNELMDIRKQ